MKKTALTAAIALTAMLAASPAFATSTKDFVEKAAMSDMFEIASSKIALERAQNAEVKAFAQKMIDDHTASSAKMKEALAGAKADVQPPAALDEKHTKKLEKLQKADAEDFDEDYLNIQQKAHRKAVSLFKDYADDGDNAALKSFASATLPTLEAHKDHVNQLEDKLD
ncbi:MAG TPA: DUF4142 domain-containing protein [Patescibacteria group bacterium]|nr:DUF4142 domain-containing protein [Patescibacteria group bacterium]